MIKEWPGWINYLILWGIYFLLTAFIDAICYWTKIYPMMHWFLDAFISGIYTGGYLAKWRFYQQPDGTWESRFF